MRDRIGGTFAPPLSDETLAGYAARIAALPVGPVRDACETLLACCSRWWELPEPEGTPTHAHPSGLGRIVTLDPAHALALDSHIPWAHELAATQTLIDGISAETDKPTRDMAFHLLWHVKELDLGREPMTTDKL